MYVIYKLVVKFTVMHRHYLFDKLYIYYQKSKPNSFCSSKILYILNVNENLKKKKKKRNVFQIHIFKYITACLSGKFLLQYYFQLRPAVFSQNVKTKWFTTEDYIKRLHLDIYQRLHNSPAV